jgi:hypothetical protein
MLNVDNMYLLFNQVKDSSTKTLEDKEVSGEKNSGKSLDLGFGANKQLEAAQPEKAVHISLNRNVRFSSFPNL